MKRILLPMMFVMITALVSCSSNGGFNELTFKNDFESIAGWSQDFRLAHGVAHSGFNSCWVDTNFRYSNTFKIKFKDISSEPIKKVYFKAWCYSETLPAKGNLVLNVRNSTTDNIVYVGIPLENYITESKKWFEIEGETSFNADANKPDNEVGFFVWNLGSSKVYFDDCTLEFSK